MFYKAFSEAMINKANNFINIILKKTKKKKNQKIKNIIKKK